MKTSGLNAAQLISDLTLIQTANYNFTLETPYGLVIKVNQDAIQKSTTVSTSLKQNGGTQDSVDDDSQKTSDAPRHENESTPSNIDDNAQQVSGESSHQNTADDTHSPSYNFKYRLFPEYLAGFLWYDPFWPGNPEDEYEVPEDDILARYGQVFTDAYDEWIDKYDAAFLEQGCDTGSGNELFPDLAERKAWILEGMMLAVWLAQQVGVESVKYSTASEKVVFDAKNGLDATVAQFLADLDRHSTEGK
ncbi:hypothetical protein F5Y17DRAFT_385842 [Xylariaceae sp. FL0594]|nr:hypothetical protein F5Y17DRAFT_385842 [Xylariaceae sp. FL0594]